MKRKMGVLSPMARVTVLFFFYYYYYYGLRFLFVDALDVTASVSITVHKGRLPHNHHPQTVVEQSIRDTLVRVAAGYPTHADKTLTLMTIERDLSAKSEQALRHYLFSSSAAAAVNSSHPADDGAVGKRRRLLSERLEERIARTSDCFQVNYANVVERLLLSSTKRKPAEKKKGGDDLHPPPLFAKIDVLHINNNNNNNNSESDHPNNSPDEPTMEISLGSGGIADGQSSTKETEGYDTAQQVVAHTARDWTKGAQPCRDETSGWILQQLTEYYRSSLPLLSSITEEELHVLVPGAGLGRLAYDIATCVDLGNVCVEANDSSAIMALASRSVLDIIVSGDEREQRVMYPFVSDPTTNEISSDKRFDHEIFPDDAAFDALRRYQETVGRSVSNLSYNVGDFVASYAQASRQGRYDAITTCFFVDTANNIYEYVAIMKHLLRSHEVSEKKKSIWINCGPVQWHPCAWLRPTVEELYDILVASGFELIQWEIAPETVAYRHPDDLGPVGNSIPRFTRSEAYRPLRFVAVLNDRDERTGGIDKGGDLPLHLSIEYCEYLNKVAQGKK